MASKLIRKTLRAALLTGATVLVLVAAKGTASADTLHSFCYGGTTCTDTGSYSPTSNNPPKFGFTYKGGGKKTSTKGTYILAFLIPDTRDPNSITIAGGSSTSTTANLVSNSAWKSGRLTNYLSTYFSDNSLYYKGQAKNPIGNYITASNATSYYVYTANLGTTTLSSSKDKKPTPKLSLNGSLPQDSFILAYLFKTDATIVTPNSQALYVDTAGSSVPEPGSLALLGTGLIGLGFALRRRRT